MLNNSKQKSGSSSLLRSPFLWKLYDGYSLLIIFSSLVTGSLIARRVEKNTLGDIQKSLHTNAYLLSEIAAPVLSQNITDYTSLQKRILLTGEQTGMRLTVIQIDGTVIADSDKDPATMDNHANRPEILTAKTHSKGTATRFSDTTNSNRMYLALPVKEDGKTIGYARTSLPLSVIDQRLGDLRWIIILGTGLTTMVSLFLGFLLARHTVMPLISMTAVAEAMAEGQYGEKLSTTRKDEIGQLAEAFNRMAEKSQARMEMLTTDRNKLSVILGGMVEGVIAVNQNERVLHLNDAAGKLLQVASTETLEKPIWEVTRIREISEILADSLSGDAEFQRKLELTGTSGKQFIEMHASALHDGQENLVGAVVVLHDVTKLYQLETIRRDFVANASHELKTPITAIRMLVETLIDDKTLSPIKQKEFLEKMRNQSLRLSAIVTDLLTLSRLESNSEEEKNVPLDLREIIRSSAMSLSPLGRKKDISIELDLPSQSIDVSGKREGLSQVINNLLENALKYTPAGGNVRVSLSKQENQAVIQVQDTGIGISAQDQKRIFERFFCVDQARSREAGGTGLGLSIVKHIAISHGGTVDVESTLGVGSTFRLVLPLV
ncbi:Phosphate regulon sensor protein PhoR (SphS) [hydrothermal vent metagenome]|uniref:histidine kinase n=1 Tax=hydrothermal vent metagenome TaxID=652676 RepID=A0A3B1E0H6_9ZZZZ